MLAVFDDSVDEVYWYVWYRLVDFLRVISGLVPGDDHVLHACADCLHCLVPFLRALLVLPWCDVGFDVEEGDGFAGLAYAGVEVFVDFFDAGHMVSFVVT